MHEDEAFALRMGAIAKADRGRIASDRYILSEKAVTLAGNILMMSELPREEMRGALEHLMEWRDEYWKQFPNPFPQPRKRK